MKRNVNTSNLKVKKTQIEVLDFVQALFFNYKVGINNSFVIHLLVN